MFKAQKNIAIGGGLLLLLLLISRRVFADSNAPENTTRLAQLAAQGIRPTQSQSTYAAWADVAFSVMDKSSFDEAPNSSLWAVIEQLQNEADWIKLKLAYGTRQLRFFGLPDGQPMNLPAALSYEGLFAETQKRLARKGIKV